MTGVGALTPSSAHGAAGCKSTTRSPTSGARASAPTSRSPTPGTPWTAGSGGSTYASGQRITTAWNGTATQSGSAVTVKSLSYNGSLRTGGSTSFGFNGTWSGSNPVPTTFTLNGVTCGSVTGSATPTPTATPTATPTPTPTPTGNAHADSDGHRAPGTTRWRSTVSSGEREEPGQPVRQADPAPRHEHARSPVVLELLLQRRLAGRAGERLEGRRPAHRDVRAGAGLRDQPLAVHLPGQHPGGYGRVARHVRHHRFPHADPG